MNIQITILPEEVSFAKQAIQTFDAQKTYNKFTCTNNYIGFLGELVLHKYLTTNHISHEWNNFIQKGWNKPDFIINNKSIDLKTTVTNGLWYQTPKYDYYIAAHINQENTLLTIKGIIGSQEMLTKSQVITHHNRTDYLIPFEKLNTLYWNEI